jgi:hypothetical protein
MGNSQAHNFLGVQALAQGGMSVKKSFSERLEEERAHNIEIKAQSAKTTHPVVNECDVMSIRWERPDGRYANPGNCV